MRVEPARQLLGGYPAVDGRSTGTWPAVFTGTAADSTLIAVIR